MNFDGDRVVTRLLADDPAVVPTICAALKGALVGPGTPPDGRPAAPFEGVMRAAGQRLTDSPEMVQVAMMVALPNEKIARATAPFDRIALEDAQGPVALAAALLTRASDAADPAFERAAQSEDARLVELAELLQARLQNGDRSYANYQGFGPPQARQQRGTAAMTPASP